MRARMIGYDDLSALASSLRVALAIINGDARYIKNGKINEEFLKQIEKDTNHVNYLVKESLEDRYPMAREMFGFMALHDNENAPDGAWWALLQDSAQFWSDEHGLEWEEFRCFDAVQDYITWGQVKDSTKPVTKDD